MQRSRVVLSVGVALGSLALAARSPASDLRGTLAGAESLTPTVRQDPPRFRAAYWEVPNGVLPITTARASVEFDVGVILTGPGITESTQPVGIRVEGGRCRPGTVVVSPGTTLDITNADLVGHELYAVARGSTERVVPAQVVTPRTRRQVQLAQPGVYELRDVRQPSFRCWVIAGQGQGRILLPNAAGAFAATGLNDGAYTVKVYFEGAERASQAVEIAGREAQVQVSLGGAAAPAPEGGHHHEHGDR
ncbi:MAG: hypothetical protein U0326_06855 [Polyangiales bacterium]